VKKILILTAKIGSGHISPALAVKSTIEKLCPEDCTVDVVDFALESGAVMTDRFLKSSWNGALNFPFLTRLVFNVLNFMYPVVSAKSLSHTIFRSWLLKGGKYIRKYNPDIVFSTHFLCSSIACSTRILGKKDYEVISFMTDPFGGHKLWADKRVDKILVSTQKAKEYLLKIGIESEKTVIIPYPLKDEFFINSQKIIREINVEKLTVLISYGGQGIGKSYKIIRDLFKKDLNINIIAVTGNNKVLQKNLEILKTRTTGNTNLIIEGYVDNMHTLMLKSNLLLSKAGPASVFECIATSCPIIITHWVGLNEKYVMEFCVENQIGRYIPKRKDLVKFMESVINDEALYKYKQNIFKLKESLKIQMPIEKGAEYAAKIITDRFHN